MLQEVGREPSLQKHGSQFGLTPRRRTGAITAAKARARLGSSLLRGAYITADGENSTHAGKH